jgi:hypothetical protein
LVTCVTEVKPAVRNHRAIRSTDSMYAVIVFGDRFLSRRSRRNDAPSATKSSAVNVLDYALWIRHAVKQDAR